MFEKEEVEKNESKVARGGLNGEKFWEVVMSWPAESMQEWKLLENEKKKREPNSSTNPSA